MDAARSVAAITLAGSKSSRVGNPKALLRFGDEPSILQIARVLKADFDDIVVVAAPNQEFPPLPARVARDEVPFQRPAAGIS